jgi:hypothetical protein
VGVCTGDTIANNYKQSEISNSGIYFSFATGRLFYSGKMVMEI